MVGTIEAVHLGPCFGYVNNDLDLYISRSQMSKSKICLELIGGTFCGYEIKRVVYLPEDTSNAI